MNPFTVTPSCGLFLVHDPSGSLVAMCPREDLARDVAAGLWTLLEHHLYLDHLPQDLPTDEDVMEMAKRLGMDGPPF